MTKLFVIPDTQIRPGDDTRFLRAIGNYIVDKRPDIIVQIGDWADMPSLSSYDFGKRQFEGRRYRDDIRAANEAMDILLGPIRELRAKAVEGHRERYNPRMVLTLGNHESRITRAVDNDSKLEGTIGLEDLKYKEAGWEVYPFLETVIIEGVAFSHYFVTGVAGRPASSAAAQLRKTSMSAIAGHQQGRQVAYGSRADGKVITNIIAGSCYEHTEGYLGPQGNKHWHGCIMLHEIKDGTFDEMFVSLDYIKAKYGE
jgi:hypothetical protein